MNSFFLVLAVVITMVGTFFIYRQGLKDGRAVKDEKPLEDIKPEIKLLKKKPTLTAEQKRYQQILDNIERYNGTAEGQKKVK